MPSSPSRATTHPQDSATTLARWREEEARVRAQLQPPGVARPEQMAELSGLELFASISAGKLPSVPIAAALGFWPIEFEHGRFVFQGQTNAAFLNPMGSMHGGWIATLLDSAVACAIQTTLPAGQGQTTVELNEPPRLLRRLLRLREWSHDEEVTEVFPRGHRARRAHGVRRQGPVPVAVGGH